MVIKDGFIYVIGELLSKAFPFLLLPYLSRKLGVEGFGELSYYQTFLVLFIMVLGLSQEAAVSRYFYFYGKRSLDLIVKAGYIYVLTMGIIIFTFSIIFNSVIMAYIAFSAIFQTLLSVQLSIRQCRKNAISYVLIQLTNGGLTVLFTFIALEFYTDKLVEKRVLAVLLSNIISFSISYLLYIKNYRYKKYKKFSLKYYKLAFFYILGFGFPLLFHQISLYTKGQLDRVFIYHRFTETDLGLYAMGAQLAGILMVLIQAANKATLPYYFEALKKKSIRITNIFWWSVLSVVAVPIVIFIIWCIPNDVFSWLLGDDFSDVKTFLMPFSISTVLTIPYLFLVNYLFYLGKNKWISFCSFSSTLFYIVAVYFSSFFGIQYVAYSTIIGNIIVIFMLYKICYKFK